MSRCELRCFSRADSPDWPVRASSSFSSLALAPPSNVQLSLPPAMSFRTLVSPLARSAARSQQMRAVSRVSSLPRASSSASSLFASSSSAVGRRALSTSMARYETHPDDADNVIDPDNIRPMFK